MSADYYQCARCEAGGDYSDDYNIACECGNVFCTIRCGKLDNAEPEFRRDSNGVEHYQGDRIDESRPVTCVVCRYEHHTDYVLLQALIKHFNLTQEQVINIWRLEKRHVRK